MASNSAVPAANGRAAIFSAPRLGPKLEAPIGSPPSAVAAVYGR
jgi:hypothetical protein